MCSSSCSLSPLSVFTCRFGISCIETWLNLPSSDGSASPQVRLTSLFEEIADTFGNLASMRFQREVAGVEEADNRTRVVPLERLSAGRQKKRVVLAPHRQERRLLRAEVFLE